MSKDVIAVLTLLAPTLAGLLAVIVSWINHQAITTAKDKINEVHISINSRVDDLVRKETALSHAAGVAEGRAAAVAEAAIVAQGIIADAALRAQGNLAGRAEAAAEAVPKPDVGR